MNYLAIDRDAHKIDDPRVVQCFVPSGTVGIGVVSKKACDESISRIYDRERLLIETIRYKTKLPYDLYREVIGSFRAIASELYTAKMCDYLESFPRKEAILRTIFLHFYMVLVPNALCAECGPGYRAVLSGYTHTRPEPRNTPRGGVTKIFLFRHANLPKVAFVLILRG